MAYRDHCIYVETHTVVYFRRLIIFNNNIALVRQKVRIKDKHFSIFFCVYFHSQWRKKRSKFNGEKNFCSKYQTVVKILYKITTGKKIVSLYRNKSTPSNEDKLRTLSCAKNATWEKSTLSLNQTNGKTATQKNTYLHPLKSSVNKISKVFFSSRTLLKFAFIHNA